MADLFTVTLRRQQIITVYDKKGQRSGETTTWLEESHHDCPAQLVATYRRMYPDNVVKVEAEARIDTRQPRRSTARTNFDARGTDRRSDRQNRPHTATAASEAPIYGGDYADAVNAAVKREARVQ